MKREEESDYEYQKRLVYGKLIDKTLADYDYSELAPYVYGKDYSCDVARRMMYGSCKTMELANKCAVSNISDDNILSEIDNKKIELQKERQKFFDQRTAFNKVVRDRSRQEELNEILTKAISAGNLPVLNYVQNTGRLHKDNDLLVSLNDIHYGMTVDNYWNKYNSDIFKKMLSNYLDDIVSIGETHESQDCIVWMGGDAISGNIHTSIQVSNKENVIEQITGVSELIAEFLSELSRCFHKVYFVSVAGNHSRLNQNKDEAIMQERLDDLVEWYLKARFQDFNNIVIGYGEKIDCSMFLIDVRGKYYLGVHGDYDGGASKIQSLQSMLDKKLYAVLSGHLHHNKIDEVQGIKTIMAGSFLGMDDYCVKKRIYGSPKQLVCVCNENGVLCSYDINLRKN